MSVHLSNTYKEDLDWLHFNDKPRLREAASIVPTVLYTHWFLQHIQEAIGIISTDVTAAFHVRPDSRLLQTRSNLKRQTLQKESRLTFF